MKKLILNWLGIKSTVKLNSTVDDLKKAHEIYHKELHQINDSNNKNLKELSELKKTIQEVLIPKIISLQEKVNQNIDFNEKLLAIIEVDLEEEEDETDI